MARRGKCLVINNSRKHESSLMYLWAQKASYRCHCFVYCLNPYIQAIYSGLSIFWFEYILV